MQLLGFLIAATFWPSLFGAGYASRWTMLFVAVPIALLFVKLKPTLLHILLGALIAWACISLLWTTVIYDGIYRLAQFATLAGCFGLGSGIHRIDHLLRGLGLGLVLSSIACILQFLGYNPVQTVAEGAPPSGLFINPDLLGELCIVVLIGLLWNRQYLLSTLILPSLILSQSRTAMVAGAICALAYVVPRARWKSFLAIPLLILMVYAIAPYKWQVAPGGGGRIDLWLDTLNGLRLWGHGIGSFYPAFIKYATHIDTFHYQPDTAHNDLLQFAFELGVPATILSVGLVVAIWKVAGEGERLILLCFAVMGLLSFPLYNPATAAVFAIVAGFAARNWNNLRQPVGRRRLSLYPWRGQAYYDRIGESCEPVSVRS